MSNFNGYTNVKLSLIYTVICVISSITTNQLSIDHEYFIKEEVPIGTLVGNLVDDVLSKLLEMGLIQLPKSDNPNKGPKDVFNFKIVNYADVMASSFDIKPDGYLIVSRRLDRDQMCPNYQSNSGLLTDSKQSNQFYHHPKTLANHKNILTESISCPVILQVALLNKNTNNNNKNSNNFDSIHTTNLGKSQSRIFLIRVDVQDINDNPPYWQGHLKRFRITYRDGDAVGSRRNLPPAIDNDVGANARITYELAPIDEFDKTTLPFSLIEDPTDGLHLYATKTIDREEKAEYKFLLKAIDGVSSLSDTHSVTTKQYTSTLILEVFIEDVNDNAPRFTQSIFTTVNPVPETTPVGTTLLILNATDLDTGINGAFHFGFSKEHFWLPTEEMARHYFDIRPNGHVVVRQPLNVDRMDWDSINSGLTPNQPVIDKNAMHNTVRGVSLQFRFRAIVEDEAVRPYTHSSEATVVILVVDENDEAPVIIARSAPESINTGTTDNSPTINPFSYFNIMENQPVGTLVGTIQTYDPDFGGQDQVECNLRNLNFSLTRSTYQMRSHFEQNANIQMSEYNIISSTNLDREVSAIQMVHIICSDMVGHYTERNLTIHILDQNDNAPKFVQEFFYLHVEENAPKGTLVQMKTKTTQPMMTMMMTIKNQMYPMQNRLIATDADAGTNAVVNYYLLEEENNFTFFQIDLHTGALSTNYVFDRETKDQYIFKVLGVDKGNPPLSGTATIQVTIDDTNDNGPLFSQNDYIFHILENQPRITPIGQISATDLDSPTYGSIVYALTEDRDASTFMIDSNSGIIRSRQNLDRENQSRYVFRVIGKDMASIPNQDSNSWTIKHTGTATVTIIVDDVNDNWPIFVSPNSTANTLAVAIDQTLGYKLAYIQATDADEGDNSLISYSIRAGNSHGIFGLDPASGLLFLSGSPGTIWPLNNNNNDNNHNLTQNTSNNLFENTKSTIQPEARMHILTLEACDHGKNPKPRCTLFNNLKIIIQNTHKAMDNNGDVEASLKSLNSILQNEQHSDQQGNQLNENNPGGTGLVKLPTALPYGDAIMSKQSTIYWRYGTNEILIVCLSLVFLLVLVATFLLFCLVRKRFVGYRTQKKTPPVIIPKKDLDWNQQTCTERLGQELSLDFVDNQRIPNENLTLLDAQKSNKSYEVNFNNSTTTAMEPLMFQKPKSPNSYKWNGVKLDYQKYGYNNKNSRFHMDNLKSQIQDDGQLGNSHLLNNSFGTTDDQIGRTNSRFDNYQTLDYLGLVSSTAPNNRCCMNNKQFGMITYSPRCANLPRLEQININSNFNYDLIQDTNASSQTFSVSQHLTTNDNTGTYQIAHLPRPTTSLNDKYTIPALTGYNFHPNLTFHTANNMGTSVSCMNDRGYATATSPVGVTGHKYFPTQSHTYYDIRQSELISPISKSKSQQLCSDLQSTVEQSMRTNNLLINKSNMDNKTELQSIDCERRNWSSDAESPEFYKLNNTNVTNDTDIDTTTKSQTGKYMSAALHESSFV